jgi:tRNA nucleotidyltransferase (CCA-adding enzyme)
MKIYEVGGAVRDALLGLPAGDRDWVVVGATPDAMRAAGYLPVGRDFPVFLHPKTHEEYALARTERKTAPGYHGFAFHASPEVTLEEDLARRDLTINAIARATDGTLIDPFDGRTDLARKVLRHVGPAFAEDPVRILRLARFAARFAEFSIAPDTLALCRAMVAAGEVDHLVPERVWAELAKTLAERRPSRFFDVLRDCGALARLFPEIDRLSGVPQRSEYHPEGDAFIHTLMVLDAAAARGYSTEVRFAALLHDIGKGLTPADLLPRHPGHETRGVAAGEALCARFRVPNAHRDLAILAIREHGRLHQLGRGDGLRPDTIVRVLREVDAFRRPERFERLLEVCVADDAGRSGEQPPYVTDRRWRACLTAAQTVDAGAVAAACDNPADIPDRIEAARTHAVASRLAADASDENGDNNKTTESP